MKTKNSFSISKTWNKDQLENVFVFDLETHNEQEFPEACAAGWYYVKRLRDKWERDLTTNELEAKREKVTVFDG